MRPDSLLKILEVFRRAMEVWVITGVANLTIQSVSRQWTSDDTMDNTDFFSNSNPTSMICSIST